MRCLIRIMNPYRKAMSGYRKTAFRQGLLGLLLVLVIAGSAQAQEVFPAPDGPAIAETRFRSVAFSRSIPSRVTALAGITRKPHRS